MWTQHSSPGSMVSADADVEVTKDNQLIRPRHRRQACHLPGVDADDGGEFASLKVQAEAHQAIVDALRQTGQSSHDVVPDDKSHARDPSLCPGATTPEEGVAGTHLLHLAFFGEQGLTKCKSAHLVLRQFQNH
nr:unnamed protein product [Spirometra erinaceieuropaei]